MIDNDDLEFSDYGRWHGPKLAVSWFLLLFAFGALDYYVYRCLIRIVVDTVKVICGL